MLTDSQGEIFSKLLDKNYELRHSSEVLEVRKQQHREVNDLDNELKDSMGEDAYNRFMTMGKKLFS